MSTSQTKPEVATGNVGGKVRFKTDWGWYQSHPGEVSAASALEALITLGVEQGPDWADLIKTSARWEGCRLVASVSDGMEPDGNGSGETIRFYVLPIIPNGCPGAGTGVAECPICGQSHEADCPQCHWDKGVNGICPNCGYSHPVI